MPNGQQQQGRHDFRPTAEELSAVHEIFAGEYSIPTDFQQTAPPEAEPRNGKNRPASLYYRLVQAHRQEKIL